MPEADAINGVLPGLVLIAAGLRFLWFSRKRRRTPNWQPLEVQIIELLAVLITGKRATGDTWRQIDFVLLSALVLMIVIMFPSPSHPQTNSSGVSVSSIANPIH